MARFDVRHWKESAALLLALILILILHGAIPGVAIPTFQQALWTLGFGQSFVNESLLTILARNIGAPHPAAIAFGLAGAYPAGLLIAAGLHPADAYAGMAAGWLTLAFLGAWRFGLVAGLHPLMAVLGATCWMSSPIIWGHAGYSMVSLGIALLPFYFFAALRLFMHRPPKEGFPLGAVVVYLIACQVAVFMDGYSFMMFAVGSSLFAAYVFFRLGGNRAYLLKLALPAHVFSFGVAYLCFTAYIGRLQFPSEALDFFRAWGVDVSFLVRPTQGIHWVWDMLGWSTPRTMEEFFGDDSVWETTFSLPLIIAGGGAWWAIRKRHHAATGLLFVALLGFYMALGPSLKVDSTKPPNAQSVQLMAADQAVAPTGSAWLSKKVPGFKNMRAAYRWTALGMFGFWSLLIVFVGNTNDRGRRMGFAVLAMLLVSNLPHVEEKWAIDKENRKKFFRIDTDLLVDLRDVVPQGSLVAFLPFRNDFLISYLAPKLNIRTYNIGGDKNLAEARRYWPPTLKQFGTNRIDPLFSERVLLALSRHEADAIILPHVNMSDASVAWPPPLSVKEELLPVTSKLKDSMQVSVVDRRYFSVVRDASPVHVGTSNLVAYPITVLSQPGAVMRILGEGWHDLEDDHVWSSDHAELELPIPESCSGRQCRAVLSFVVFGASPSRHVEVVFTGRGKFEQQERLQVVNVADVALQRVTIPLQGGQPSYAVLIDIPEATSPNDMHQSSDVRILGIGLFSVELEQG